MAGDAADAVDVGVAADVVVEAATEVANIVSYSASFFLLVFSRLWTCHALSLPGVDPVAAWRSHGLGGDAIMNVWISHGKTLVLLVSKAPEEKRTWLARPGEKMWGKGKPQPVAVGRTSLLRSRFGIMPVSFGGFWCTENGLTQSRQDHDVSTIRVLQR